jgi:hypothetical protein
MTMSEFDRHRRLPAASADIEAGRAVDLLLKKLIVIVEQEGAEGALDVLLQYVRTPDPEGDA